MFKSIKANAAAIAELKQQLNQSELAAGEQKKRILALREENAALRAELNEHIAKSAAVSEALINSIRTAENIKARAEQQSNDMLKNAAERCAAEERRLCELHRQLKILRKSCQHILASISEEVDHPISLHLASGND